MFRNSVVASVLLVMPTIALAGADCVANPKADWKTEAEARAKFEGDGYTIKKFKVDGNCYEIYGFTKEGKKAEIYFDTKTLEIVKSEID
jgi:hypothetical protein